MIKANWKMISIVAVFLFLSSCSEVEQVENISCEDIDFTGSQGKNLFMTNCFACHSDIRKNKEEATIFSRRIIADYKNKDGHIKLDSCERKKISNFITIRYINKDRAIP